MRARYYYWVLFALILAACDNNNPRLFDDNTESKTPNFLDLTEDTSTHQKNSEVKEVVTEKSLTLPQKLLRSSVTIMVADNTHEIIGLGSGVFIEPSIIATNQHVIEKGNSFRIKLNEDEIEYTVKVVAIDEKNDVALLKTEKDFPDYAVQMQTEMPVVGTHILVAGSPEGLEGTISEGIISSIRRTSDKDLLQISAPISPGSSGGPIVNDNGELIGISVATFNTKRAQNLNFGVPAKYIQRLRTNFVGR